MVPLDPRASRACNADQHTGHGPDDPLADAADVSLFIQAGFSPDAASHKALSEIAPHWKNDYASMIFEMAEIIKRTQPSESSQYARYASLISFLEKHTGKSFGDNLDRWRNWVWSLPNLVQLVRICSASENNTRGGHIPMLSRHMYVVPGHGGAGCHNDGYRFGEWACLVDAVGITPEQAVTINRTSLGLPSAADVSGLLPSQSAGYVFTRGIVLRYSRSQPALPGAYAA